MALSLGAGQILVAQENEGSIPRPDLMATFTGKVAYCLELGQILTLSVDALC